MYLDSTATSLKPQQVIDKENEYYTKYTANVFPRIYTTSERRRRNMKKRGLTARFIGAATTANEIVFTAKHLRVNKFGGI